MVTRSRDTDFLGKAERVFAQGFQAKCVEAFLVLLAGRVEMRIGGTEKERFAVAGAGVVEIDEEGEGAFLVQFAYPRLGGGDLGVAVIGPPFLDQFEC